MDVFNDFKEYKDLSIPKGKMVVFQLLGIMKDPDNPGRNIIPRYFIRPKDSVVIDGKVHDIAVITNQTKEGYTFDSDLSFTPESGGKLILRSGTATDEKRYPFLKLCNTNASNPYRDQSVTPIFREVDYEADENAKFDVVEAEAKALGTVISLNESQIKELGKELGLLETLSIKATKMMLIDFVKQDASKVLAALENLSDGEDSIENSELKALNQKFKKRALLNNKDAKEVTFNGKVVYTYLTDELDKEEMLALLKSTDAILLGEILK